MVEAKEITLGQTVWSVQQYTLGSAVSLACGAPFPALLKGQTPTQAPKRMNLSNGALIIREYISKAIPGGSNAIPFASSKKQSA